MKQQTIENKNPLHHKNIFVKVKGILVPFYQASSDFESNYILTTSDGLEFTILKSDRAQFLDRLCWSVIDVFGYIISEYKGRKLLKVDHYACNEKEDYMVNPFLNDEDAIWPDELNARTLS